ncbi:MAG: beta strand repeat-containing protein, partial [Planctomycetota bacterium]
MNAVWAVHLNAPGMVGFVAQGEGNNISGLSIQAGSKQIPAVRIEGSSNKVSGSRIGLDAANHATGWQSIFGIELVGNNNIVGGSQPADRNFLSNNQSGVGGAGSFNRISGNLIGTSGRFFEPNAFAGVLFTDGAKGNIIGSDSDGIGDSQEGNVISGQNFTGVYLEFASNTVIRGNLIGTNPQGSATLGNGNAGIIIADAPGTIVGGSSPGQGNLISGNGQSGVVVRGSGSNDISVTGNIIGLLLDGVTKAGNGAAGISITNYASNSLNWNYGRHPWVGGPTRVTISGNTISANSVGIYVGSNQLYGTRPSQVYITGNRIGTSLDANASVPNNGAGILIDSSSDNLISNNIVAAGSGGSVSILGLLASGNRVSGNTITTSGASGVFVDSAVGTSVQSNTIEAPGYSGISLVNASGVSRVSANIIRNAAAGVSVSGSATSGLSVEGNQISQVATGISVIGGSGISAVGNSLGSVSTTGILFSSVKSGSSIRNNSLSGISGKGIVLENSSSAVVSGNNLSAIASTGIAISGSSGVELLASPGDYAIDILSSSFSGSTAISSSGSVLLSAPFGNLVSFSTGVTVSSASVVRVSGAISSANGAITLGDADTPVILEGDTAIDSGTAATILGGAVDGAFSLTIAGGGANQIASQAGAVVPLAAFTTAATGTISVSGITSTGNIVLGNHATVSGAISSNQGGFTAKAGLSAPNDLRINSPAGTIVLEGKVAVAGRAAFKAGVSVTANNSANQFGDVVTVTAPAVTLAAGGSVSTELMATNATISAGSNATVAGSITGNLDVTAIGAINQSGPLSVGQRAVFSGRSTDDVRLDGSNNFQILAITQARNVVVRDTDAITLGNSFITGGLSVIAGGAISSDALKVGGLASFTTGGAGALSL